MCVLWCFVCYTHKDVLVHLPLLFRQAELFRLFSRYPRDLFYQATNSFRKTKIQITAYRKYRKKKQRETEEEPPQRGLWNFPRSSRARACSDASGVSVRVGWTNDWPGRRKQTWAPHHTYHERTEKVALSMSYFPSFLGWLSFRLMGFKMASKHQPESLGQMMAIQYFAAKPHQRDNWCGTTPWYISNLRTQHVSNFSSPSHLICQKMSKKFETCSKK